MGGKFKKGKSLVKKNETFSRKEMRKQSRKEKKERQNNHHRNKNKSEAISSVAKNIKAVKQITVGKVESKTIMPSNSSDNRSTALKQILKKTDESNILDEQNKEHKEEIREQKKLERGMKNRRKKSLLEANKQEDKEIKKLEKQLRLNKRKSKSIPKSFADEGLDYLLEICDSDKMFEISKAEMNLQESGSEFEDDFAQVTGKSKKRKLESVDTKFNKKTKLESTFVNQPDDGQSSEEDDLSLDENDEDLSVEQDHDELDNDNSDEESDINSNDQYNEDDQEQSGEEDISDLNNDENKVSDDDMSNEDEYSDEKNTGSLYKKEQSEQSSDGEDDSQITAPGKKIKKSKLEGTTWEDIYGRLRDKTGNIITVQEKNRYVPPHLRAQQLGENTKTSEEMMHLKRQLKGLINRLAESNLRSIANQIDELYMRNSRNNMNDCLLSLISEALISPVITPERLVMEHTMLIAILHANVGIEIGAHFLQSYVQKFDELFKQSQDVENKELDNVLLIISHLYNFKVAHSILMYNILELLTQRFTEKEVELILMVLRSVGFKLRKDDPVFLKDLVLRLQKKANESTQLKDNPRVRFMLDVLLAVKNNNMAKIPQYDPSYSKHLTKLLKTMIHKGKYVTELKITLDDLLKAEERGRWWIVGSAWSGPAPTSSAQAGPSFEISKASLALARKQRMNTGTRRQIFCILISSEDYLDAFEKLLRLGLKGQQEQEILHVTIHCLLQEKTFNPYYAHLATHFCQADRKHQMTIQYHIWDKLKELSNLSQSQIANLAKFLAHMFQEKALPISVLKVMQFSEMDKWCVRLLRQTLLSLLLNDSAESVAAVFSRVSKPEKLHMFRESLRLFLHHFVLRNTKDLPQDQAQLLRERVKMAETALTCEDVSKKFL